MARIFIARMRVVDVTNTAGADGRQVAEVATFQAIDDGSKVDEAWRLDRSPGWAQGAIEIRNPEHFGTYQKGRIVEVTFSEPLPAQDLELTPDPVLLRGEFKAPGSNP